MKLGKFNASLVAIILSVVIHPSHAAEPGDQDSSFFSDEISLHGRCYKVDAVYANEGCLLPSENALIAKLRDWKARVTKEDYNLFKSESEKVKIWNEKVKKAQELAKNKDTKKDFSQ